MGVASAVLAVFSRERRAQDGSVGERAYLLNLISLLPGSA